jgi:hypothetical protein
VSRFYVRVTFPPELREAVRAAENGDTSLLQRLLDLDGPPWDLDRLSARLEGFLQVVQSPLHLVGPADSDLSLSTAALDDAAGVEAGRRVPVLSALRTGVDHEQD